MRTASAVLLTLRRSTPGRLLAQEAGALGERLGVGEDGRDLLQLDLLAGDQVGAHGEVVLADDRHRLGLEGERVERAAHRTLDRVLERHQGPLGLAPLDGEDRVVDGRRAQRLELVVAAASRSASSVKVPAGPR